MKKYGFSDRAPDGQISILHEAKSVLEKGQRKFLRPTSAIWTHIS